MIDDRKIEVPEGTKVIAAAEAVGIYIPRFCYHPALESVGACRVCAVKFLEGPVKGIDMSCMIDAQDGMKVSTTHPDAVAFRKYIIECLMINHPHDCPVCDEGGHCLLQDLTVAGGHGVRQYKGAKRTYNDQYLGPLVQHEMNRCIQCYRCVRYYREYSGYKDLGVMGIAGRITYGRFDEGCLESPFSGNLIDICPTGVYTDRPSRYLGRRWDFVRSGGICIHCGAGCNTVVSTRYREVVRQEARFNSDINGHFICDRGRYGFYYANLPQRPRQGRVEKDAVSTGRAIEAAAEKAGGIEAAFGASSIVVFGSDRSSLETLAGLRVVCETRGWQLPAFWPETLGRTIQTALSSLSPEFAVSMGAIESADFILGIGTDPVSESPMLALTLRQAQRKEVRIRIIDPRPLDLPFSFDQIPCKVEDMAEQLYQIIQAIDSRDKTFGEVSSELQALADDLVRSERPVIVCGTEITTPDIVARAGQLAQVLKKQRPRTGLFYTLPHANSYGASLLFGNLQSVEDLLEKIEQNKIKAALFLESDLWEQFPDRNRLVLALKKLELIIAIDCLDNPLAQMAHIHIPTQTVFEAGGIYVNQEGRVQYAQKAQSVGLPIAISGRGSHPPRSFQKEAPGSDILSASEALQGIGEITVEDFSHDGGGEMEKRFPGLAGLSDMLGQGDGSIGAERFYADHHQNQIGALSWKPEEGGERSDYEILIVPSVWGDEVLSTHSPCLETFGEKTVWFSKEDADNLNIAQGDAIILDLPQAPLTLKAQLSEQMASGIVVIPRRCDLFWQQLKSGERLFVKKESIRIDKKE